MKKLKTAIGKAKDADLQTTPALQENLSQNTGLESIEYTQTRQHRTSSFSLMQNRILSGREDAQLKSSYNMLRTQVLQKMRANNWNSLAVISANAGEGKSTTSANLAISLAEEVNHTVMLADFDLAKPSIHKLFCYEPEFGIADYLQDKAKLSDVLVNPEKERLVIMPGRIPVENSSSMLTTPKMLSMVEEVKHRYPSRVVIFDLPALLNSDDALVFLPYVDAVLLVVGEGKSSEAELMNVANLIGDKPVLGTVFNQVSGV